MNQTPDSGGTGLMQGDLPLDTEAAALECVDRKWIVQGRKWTELCKTDLLCK